jgi:hypothetical protein
MTKRFVNFFSFPPLLHLHRFALTRCNKKLSMRLSESITLFRLFLFFITPRISEAFFFLFKSRSYQVLFFSVSILLHNNSVWYSDSKIWSWLYIVLWRNLKKWKEILLALQFGLFENDRGNDDKISCTIFSFTLSYSKKY